jgi:diadenosine tetraphosphatase ApaH/serine/threonine PP2A family protein phosphatase
MLLELIDGVFYCPDCGIDYHGATIDEISIEAVVGTCPCCYEDFSNQDQNTMARKLPCTHIICYGCIEGDLIEEVYYCPECGFENYGEDVNDFTINAEGAPSNNSSDIPKSVFNSTIEEIQPISNSRASVGRMPCKFPNCPNKSLYPSNFCLAHSDDKNITSNRSSVKLVQSITRNLQSNKLMVASTSDGLLQSLDKIKIINPNDLIEKFRKQERLVLGEAMELIDNTKAIMLKEPNILRLDAPIVVVGDVHGQYYDLLNLLEEGGDPKDTQYLFLGDYVDRGNFSCEVMFLLCILKTFYPNNIHLLRGNHECASVSGHFGFKKECKMKYGLNIYYKFCLLFQTMPLGAVVSTAYGEMFACHGGLSPNLKTLDDIDKLDRFIEPESNLDLLDVLWSDPIREEKIEDMNDKEFESFMEIDFHSNPARGCSFIFGYKALKEFLDTNSLVCLIRAHEVQEDGFKKHFDPAILEAHMKSLLSNQSNKLNSHQVDATKENDFPPLITIFSAPNYCDRYENKGAILKIDMALDDFRIIQYDCVEHPEPELLDSESDNHISTIISLCPYMPTSFPNFVRLAIELGPENLLELENDPTLEVNEKEEKEKEDDEIKPLLSCNPIDKYRRESKSRRESVQISLVRSAPSYKIRSNEIIQEELLDNNNQTMSNNEEGKKIGKAAARWAEAIDKTRKQIKNKVGEESLKRRVSQLGFQRNSDIYVQSMASDAINEVHPESNPFNKNKENVSLILFLYLIILSLFTI